MSASPSQTQLEATLVAAEQCRVDLETTNAKFAMVRGACANANAAPAPARDARVTRFGVAHFPSTRSTCVPRAQWKDENVRRKHNYVPFAVAFLKQLAKKRMLEGLVRKAEQKRLEREAVKKARR